MFGDVLEDFTDEILELLQALKAEKASVVDLGGSRFRRKGILRHPAKSGGEV